MKVELIEEVKYDENIFELKKNRVYKKDMSLICLVVNSTIDNYKRINKDFYEIQISDKTNFLYISFRYALSDTKLVSIHINNINNVKVRFEIINKIDILDKARCNGTERIVRDLLLSIKHREAPLFISME